MHAIYIKKTSRHNMTKQNIHGNMHAYVHKIVKYTQSNSWVCLEVPWDQIFKG